MPDLESVHWQATPAALTVGGLAAACPVRGASGWACPTPALLAGPCSTTPVTSGRRIVYLQAWQSWRCHWCCWRSGPPMWSRLAWLRHVSERSDSVGEGIQVHWMCCKASDWGSRQWGGRSQEGSGAAALFSDFPGARPTHHVRIQGDSDNKNLPMFPVLGAG